LPLSRVERIVEDEIVAETDGDLDLGLGHIPFDFRASQGVPETPYGELIFETARRHRINPTLVAAMVRAESAFNPRAVSPKGAAGLLQLMPATAERFGLAEKEIFDPARNLETGVRYLAWLNQRFDGDLQRILAGYNAGEATVDRYAGVPPFRETHDYIRRVYEFAGGQSAAAGTR
jgi:soluble lytic murein transglycosylase-like protein